MIKKFYKAVDKRSAKAMRSFLRNHFRYRTANSWNGGTSYANNLKICNLCLPNETRSKLYEMLDVQSFYDEINFLVEEWGHNHNYQWQAGFNGRSGGYLVLYQGELRPSGYKSYCIECGQPNYNTATEKSNQCGRCGGYSRVNYEKPHMVAVTYPFRGTDVGENFSEWSIDELKARVEIVQSFDQLCDDIVALAIDLANNHKVVEETIYVPQKVKVLQEIG